MASQQLAQSLMNTERYEQALQELESCGVMSPDVELNKGLCYAALGRLSRARGVLDGLRLRGFDRHADQLAHRLAEDVPSFAEAPPDGAEVSEKRSRKLAVTYGVFAVLGALLILEGVYVGAGLVGGADSKEPAQPRSEVVVPAVTPSESIAVSQDAGVRVINLGFPVDTTSLLGQWHTVDFVDRIEDFQPGKVRYGGSFFVQDMGFGADKVSTMNGGPCAFQWEPGWIMDAVTHVKSQYAVRTFDGSAYLFLPWLNGDVTVGGMRPHFYVLQKVD